MTDETLPEVGIRRLDIPLLAFERKCLLQIGVEQRKASPDSALLQLLCQAVGLSRECSDNFGVGMERVIVMSPLDLIEAEIAPKTAREFDATAKAIADSWFDETT